MNLKSFVCSFVQIEIRNGLKYLAISVVPTLKIVKPFQTYLYVASIFILSVSRKALRSYE
ncbi:hypothetical protein BpHYR1_002831 [Brachionus plicatilis]|uniref:Uncharacterized protein n=1 Tax=Brachionus plicatilis TaxID=10195 RepID=A0A3M7P439_BRAPC|nr:hypothetical protein BpHYR1_002831 [Brachionus plicatilis]